VNKTEVALGSGDNANISVSKYNEATDREKIDLIEQQIRQMHRVIMAMRKDGKRRPLIENPNKDGIPVGIVCTGNTEKAVGDFYLFVERDGYRVGDKKYPSLSSAAEAVSHVRRSGWTFWHLPGGRTLKEVYGK
jgi:hypothetical protein